MAKKLSNLTKATLILLASLLIVFLIAGFTDLRATLDAMKRISFEWIFAILLLVLFDWFSETLTVWLFARSYKAKVSLIYLFKNTLVGRFFSAITPFSTGGQPAQIAFLGKRGVEYGQATAMLVSRFLFYQIVVTGASVFGLLRAYSMFAKRISNLALLAFFGFALNGFVLFLLFLFTLNRSLAEKTISKVSKLFVSLRIVKRKELFQQKLLEQTRLFHDCMTQSAKNPLITFLALLMALLEVVAKISVTYFVARSLNIASSYFDVAMTQLVVFLVASFVPTPGATGASEGVYTLFFKFLFGPKTVAALLVWRFFTYYLNIIVGGLATAHELGQMKNEKS
ncbi:MAG: lysylphosphatidylglycerol synthase transmembrane domain-containing protein [Pseudothermotoga sp.]|uniref:lysylphosphatidylglycerol synthase transmembrane domain-containing protein n=1 Tax=Pseudothermotoga sp. TaxID=2033661 RepID=UPI0025848B79|nr:lysylphosphatidylglycerol synthase transmembrane domain-containing protein [Pseudothermotoga sp.]MDI6862408.1 lysylphosphatidylglycerol synthase transmembrane domain-containing protein [Pseudothermotoga sp.]